MTLTSDAIVSSLRGDYHRVSFHPRDFLPEKLCHYTSASGLLGILRSGVLRGSNFAYLNDSSEIRYGDRIVREVLDQYFGESRERRAQQVLQVTIGAMEKITSHIEFYLACFCTEADLLSQWRGYGTSADRYCIIFDPDELHNGTQAPEIYFDRVIYERDEQIASVTGVLDRALQAAQDMTRLDQAQQKECAKGICNTLFQRLVRIMCFFKHHGFHEEKEWRAVHWLQDIGKVNFETRGGSIRPYIDLFLGSDDPPKLPIREVIVGSSAVVAQSRKSVELLIEKQGYSGIAVTESGLPYREL